MGVNDELGEAQDLAGEVEGVAEARLLALLLVHVLNQRVWGGYKLILLMGLFVYCVCVEGMN